MKFGMSDSALRELIGDTLAAHDCEAYGNEAYTHYRCRLCGVLEVDVLPAEHHADILIELVTERR